MYSYINKSMDCYVLNSNLGDTSVITNNVIHNVSEFLKYCVDNGYLPDVNELSLIPIMTNDTTPRGVASASNFDTTHSTNYRPFNALDGNANTWWITQGSTNEYGQWLQYMFDVPVVVTKIEMNTYVDSNSSSGDFELSASNDGTNFTSLKTFNAIAGKTTEKIYNSNSYSYYRLTMKSTVGNYLTAHTEHYTLIQSLQLYGH